MAKKRHSKIKSHSKSFDKRPRSILKHKLNLVTHRNKPLKTPKTLKQTSLVRLEAVKQKLRKYINKNLSKNKVLSKYNPQNLTLRTDDVVCKRRSERRKEIMRRTRGKGLKVRNAIWSSDSYIICRN